MIDYNDNIPVIRNQANFKISDDDKELNLEESLTTPDESYTLREIMERFSKGIPLTATKQAFYSEEENPDFESMDITRIPGFDLADATIEQNAIQNSLAEAVKRKRVREKENKTTDTTGTDNSKPSDEA